MDTNFLIRSKAGVPSPWVRAQRNPKVRVSPFLYAQEQLYNGLFLPEVRDLPSKALRLVFHTFDFGFTDPTRILGPYNEDYFNIPMGKNTLFWAITGLSIPAPPSTTPTPATGNVGAQISPALQFNFLQGHGDVVSQWSNKPITDIEGLGTAQDPMFFRSPVLVPTGDTITADVQNMGNVNLKAQIVLHGGEFI